MSGPLRWWEWLLIPLTPVGWLLFALGFVLSMLVIALGNGWRCASEWTETL